MEQHNGKELFLLICISVFNSLHYFSISVTLQYTDFLDILWQTSFFAGLQRISQLQLLDVVASLLLLLSTALYYIDFCFDYKQKQINLQKLFLATGALIYATAQQNMMFVLWKEWRITFNSYWRINQILIFIGCFLFVVTSNSIVK